MPLMLKHAVRRYSDQVCALCRVKSLEQQAAMALHRVRDHLVRQRTGTINALRGHLAEYGIVASALRGGLNQLFSIVEADGDERFPAAIRQLLRMLVTEIHAADAHIAELDRKMKDDARTNEACRRLIEVPGIGPVIATAVVATVPDDQRFRSGRHFAAWLGLTPKQHSSGGKERLLGISKRGDAYMRRQFINGARALVRIASGRTGGLWDWINTLLSRRAFNVVTVAVANKLARVTWALQARGARWKAA